MDGINNKCQISFVVQCDKTQIGDKLYVVGNQISLGKWDYKYGIELYTNEQLFPVWKSVQPAKFLMGQRIEFKLLILKQKKEVIWENLTEQRQNRVYFIHYNEVELQLYWNKYDSREIPILKYAPSQYSEERLKQNVQQIETLVTKQKFDPNFNPLIQHDSDSEWSEQQGESGDYYIEKHHQEDEIIQLQKNTNTNLKNNDVVNNNNNNNNYTYQNKIESPQRRGIKRQQSSSYLKLNIQTPNKLNRNQESITNENQIMAMVAEEKQNQQKMNNSNGNQISIQPSENNLKKERNFIQQQKQIFKNVNIEEQVGSYMNSDDQEEDIDIYSQSCQDDVLTSNLEKLLLYESQIKESESLSEIKSPKSAALIRQKRQKSQYRLHQKQNTYSNIENNLTAATPQSCSDYNKQFNSLCTQSTGNINNKFKNQLKKTTSVPPSKKVKKKHVPDLQELFKKTKHQRQRKLLKRRSINESIYDLMNEYMQESGNDIDFMFRHTKLDNVIFCNFFLPIRVIYQESNDTFNIIFDDDTILYHYYQAFPKSIFVGIIINYYDFNEELTIKMQQEIKKLYNCYPIYIEKSKLDKYLLEFVYPILDPLMNNEIDVTDLTLEHNLQENWDLFCEICQIYSKEIQKLSNDNSFCFIIDHRILLTNSYLSRTTIKPCILYFSYGKFPHFQILKIFPFYKDIMYALMNADLISFSDFEESVNFFPIVKQMFGIKLNSRRGTLQFSLQGRNIVLNMKHPGINIRSINSKLEGLDFRRISQQIQDIYYNKKLIVGVDELEKSSNLILKLKLIQKLLGEYKNIRFVQVIIIRDHTLKDECKKLIYNELKIMVSNIEKQYPGAIKVIYDQLPQYWRLGYFYHADIFLKTSNYSLTDIFLYEYMLVNQNNGACMFFDLNSRNKLYNSLHKFNPLSYADFRRVIGEILEGDKEILKSQLDQDKEILKIEHNSEIWIQICLMEFKKNQRLMSNFHFTGTGKGTKFMKIAHNLNFKKMQIQDVMENYKGKKNRIFIFGFEGSLVEMGKYQLVNYKDNVVKKFKSKPSEDVLNGIRSLTQDKNNSVYILTELPKDFLDIWFSGINNLGLICEGGYIYKLNGSDDQNQKWQFLSEMSQDWRNDVFQVMDQFVINTQGSKILQKEKSLIWSYQGVDEIFAMRQVESLLTELKNITKNYKDVEIRFQRTMVEVRCDGINKGVFTDLLIQHIYLKKGKIDFLFTDGQGISCEDVFQSIKNMIKKTPKYFIPNIKPFTVCVGLKPSHASHYIKDHNRIEELLKEFYQYYNNQKESQNNNYQEILTNISDIQNQN